MESEKIEETQEHTSLYLFPWKKSQNLSRYLSNFVPIFPWRPSNDSCASWTWEKKCCPLFRQRDTEKTLNKQEALFLTRYYPYNIHSAVWMWSVLYRLVCLNTWCVKLVVPFRKVLEHLKEEDSQKEKSKSKGPGTFIYSLLLDCRLSVTIWLLPCLFQQVWLHLIKL